MEEETKIEPEEKEIPEPVDGPAPEIAHDEHGTVDAKKVKHPKRWLKILITLVVLALAALAWVWFALGDDANAPTQSSVQPDEQITSYEECVAAGYPVMESFPEQCAVPGGETFTNPNAVVLDKTYANEQYDFRFSYPSSWEITETRNDGVYDTHDDTTVVLTSADESELELRAFIGGLGGACVPPEGDTPHDVNSSCDTREILAVEKLENIVPSKESDEGSHSLYTVEQKYTRVNRSGGPAGTVYQICLADDAFEVPVPGEPEMGIYYNFVDPELINWANNESNETSYHLQVCIESDSEEFLTSSDSNTVRAILRTIEFAEES